MSSAFSVRDGILFWLDDEQWAKIKPFIPMNRPGQKPLNNRRILSGIIHDFERDHSCPQDRMSLEGLSTGIRPVYDGVQPLQSVERARNLAASLRDGGGIAGAARTGGAGQHPCQSAPLRWRRKRGASEQAIGLTKGGRNSKLHALVDKLCRPWVIKGFQAHCHALRQTRAKFFFQRLPRRRCGLLAVS
jgi:hypothetical protein